jgi:predicted peptidase
MKHLLVTLTAISALVVAYFISTAVFRPRQPKTSAVVSTQPATSPAPETEKPSLIALIPDSPGFYNLQFKMRVGTEFVSRIITLPCRVYIPRDYDKNKDPRPLLLFFHGDESRGSDLTLLTKVGPEKRLRDDQGFRDNFRSICVSPLCSADENWDDSDMAQALLGLVNELGKVFRVDADRISLAGTGSGVAAAWRTAAAAPDRFASVVGSAPRGSPLGGEDPQKLRHLYTYVVAAQNDKPGHDTYLATVDSLGKAKADIQFKTNGNTAAECTQWFYSDNATWDWLNNHKRRTPDERIARDVRDAKELAEAIAAIPRLPGQYKMKYTTWVGDKKIDLPYQLTLPVGYDGGEKRWPAMVFLAGAGEVNPDLSAINSHGPGAKMRDDPKFREWSPFIIISPAHDNSPECAKAICEVVNDLEKKLRIDDDRVYVTGYSLGGTTTWTVATTTPEKFAAIVPINARDRCWDVAAARLKYIPTWIIVGGADGDFFTGSVHMNAVLAAAGNEVHLTVIPNEGHSSCPRYYNDRRFYDWLLQHKRPAPDQRADRDKHPATAPAEMFAHLDKHPEVVQPGDHWLEFPTQFAGKPYNFRYSLYLPKGYDATSNLQWPLMLYLHNDEQRSTDLSMIFEYGSSMDPRRAENARTPFPMVGLVPQLPEGRQWSDPDVAKLTLALMDEVAKKIRLDADRIYATGVQNGGTALWSLALQAPNRFAAIFPYQAATYKPEEVAQKLTSVAARLICPKSDGGAAGAAKQMADALTKAHGEAQVTLVPDAPDATQWQPYYTDPELVKWLLSHRRQNAQQRTEVLPSSAPPMAAHVSR